MKRVVAIFVGVILAVGALVVAGSAGAAGPPLSAYTIYGQGGVVIGNGSTVIGLVGARDNLAGNAITLQGGSSIIGDPIHSIVGDARSGGNVRMLNQTLIQDTLTRAVGTTLTKTATSTVGHDVFANPIDLPTLPAPTPIPGGCPTAGPDSSGANGITKNISPGTFGDWTFGGNLTINFASAGTYIFNSITAANGVFWNVVPGVKVLVCGVVSMGGNVQVNGVTNPADFKLEAQGTDPHDTFKAGGGSNWVGNVYTPNGGIHFGSGGSPGTIHGQFVAGAQVDLEHGLVVTGGPGGGGGGGSNSKDDTMSHAAKNENNGATLSLLVHYQEDSVIGFDVTDAAKFPPLATKAILELTVCYTPGDLTFCPDPSDGWPAGGGKDHAFRLDDGWERWGSGFPGPTNTPPEGNGNNFPIKNNPRGSGAGVTWNCAIDTNIANEGQDCSNVNGNFWNAGLNHDDQFGPSVPSTQNLTNNMADGTKIDFDVTALYNQGMGPLDTTFMSFFVRKIANSGGGAVAYYSIQGATAKGDASLAPQLIVTP